MSTGNLNKICQMDCVFSSLQSADRKTPSYSGVGISILADSPKVAPYHTSYKVISKSFWTKSIMK
jgi:hypothetical protein